MSANRVCWSRAAIDFATQVDVGGLEADDPQADAVFRAIHQSLPVSRELKWPLSPGERERRAARLHAADHLERAAAALRHRARKVPARATSSDGSSRGSEPAPAWHVVYIEKRNTSLRRVTERILDGIDTPQGGGTPPGTRPGLLGDHQR